MGLHDMAVGDSRERSIMLSAGMRARLLDKAYRELHFQAVGVLQDLPKPSWYDAHFLTMYEAAKRYLRLVRPDCLDAFVAGFNILRTPPEFAVKAVDSLFDQGTRSQIENIVLSLSTEDLSGHETEEFGRHVVHDHPFFCELQSGLTGMMSDLVGCELAPAYNFLSLYGPQGRCSLHLDHPLSMYTLDYCIAKNANWPIYVSNPIEWPDLDAMRSWTPEMVIEDPSNEFREVVIEPGNGVIFSGSGQWHFRKTMAGLEYCNLLFFHFFPKGAQELVYFSQWPEHFSIPELTALCDLFEEAYPNLARAA